MGIDRTGKRWSRRVNPVKIRRLYESDARGMLDPALLDDVGYGFYVRCQELIEVVEAWRGQVKCWGCGNVVVRQQGQVVEYHAHGPTLGGGKTEVLACSRCAWQITWADYCKGAAGMNATGVEDDLRAFVARWPSTHSSSARLLLIDELIHAFHMHYKRVGSSIGCSVIEATERQLIDLLESLAYGTGSTPGLEKTRRRWASRLEARQIQRPKSELQTIAHELGLKGYSRMSVQELIEAIERTAPEQFEAWTRLVQGPE